MIFSAHVGVVTNMYRYLKMIDNAASQIHAVKTLHVVGDNTNNGENMNRQISFIAMGVNPIVINDILFDLLQICFDYEIFTGTGVSCS